MGIAQYETEKLFADVASVLPQIEEIEKSLEDLEKWVRSFYKEEKCHCKSCKIQQDF